MEVLAVAESGDSNRPIADREEVERYTRQAEIQRHSHEDSMVDFSTNSTDNAKPPLSQAPARKKLLIALPLSAAGAAMWWANIPGGMGLCILLGAYALVGVIELVGGASLHDAAKNWDALPGWKKGLVSILVIAAAIIAMFLTIFIYAKMTGSA